MDRMDIACTIVVVIGLGLLTVLGAIGLNGGAVPTFPTALESWTGWVASVVGIIVSARVLWTAGTWLLSRAGK